MNNTFNTIKKKKQYRILIFIYSIQKMNPQIAQIVHFGGSLMKITVGI